MSGLMNLFTGGALIKQDTDALLETNDVSRQYGLTLTHGDAIALLEVRADSLKGSGRVEIGVSAVDQILLAFCDSPYVNGENYVEIISGLIELFYYMKNETLDRLTDEELLQRMRHYFDGSAAGSLDLLAERNLESMARNIRAYNTFTAPEEEEVDEEQDENYVAGEDEKWRTVRL